METLCPCGQPLHYTDEDVRKFMENLVKEKGANIAVTLDGRTWMISRDFIALHGITGKTLLETCKQYGFKEIKGKPCE